MPVLPLVASINVSPAFILPRSSALRIIDSAGLSFTEPAGLLPSSLARITLVVFPGIRFKRTKGVLPTKSSSVLPLPARSRSLRKLACVPISSETISGSSASIGHNAQLPCAHPQTALHSLHHGEH